MRDRAGAVCVTDKSAGRVMPYGRPRAVGVVFTPMSANRAVPTGAAIDPMPPERDDATPARRVFGRRVKFIWGASRVIRGRWHLGLFGRYERRNDLPRDLGLAISVR